MWKLIKMDFYRLFHSKAIKVGALIACLATALFMLFSIGIVAIIKFTLEANPMASLGMSMFIPQIEWVNGVDFAEVVFGATAFMALFIGCMISANFIGTEQSCGYTKNFAGQLPNKGYMAVSKFVVTSAAQLLILVVYVGVASALAQLILGQYITGYDLKSLFAALGLRLMLHLAINAAIIFVCTLTKSHAVAMVVGCIFGIGITKFFYTVLGFILSAVNISFDIAEFMPDGINGQLSIGTLGDLSLKAILVSLAFIVVFVAANYFILKKRDVK